ncbi:hypothetical protein OCA08_03325 [Bacillus cereus]|nr:hypothetical protein [Bacillus cereus]
MPSLTNRLKLALPNGNEYVNRAALNKIFEDIDRLVMLQADFNIAKKEIDDNLAKKVSKSGDTMTGPLNFATSLKGVSWLDGETKKADLIYNNSEIYFRGFNGAIEKYPWVYNISTDTFSVNAQTNLLKKTGDTMTGDISFKVGQGIPNRGVRWATTAGDLWGFESSENDLLLYNYKDSKQIFKYNAALNEFTLSANTNLLKKTGDIFTGKLTMGANASISMLDTKGKDTIAFGIDTQDRFMAWDNMSNKHLFIRDTNGYFTVNADNLLKKTGDTMTGSLKFNRDRGIAWNDGTKDIHSITTGGDNKTYFTDGVNGIDYALYDPTTKSFNILHNTNLLKKSGDKMSGSLEVNTSGVADSLSMYFQDSNGMSLGLKGHKPSKTISLVDWEGGEKSIWRYNHDEKKFIVEAETNLLKKTGDKMEGHLEFRANKELQFKKDDGTSLVGVAVDNNGDFFAWNAPGNKYLWKLDGKTGEFVINANNLVSKGGDNLTGDFAYYNPNPMQFRPHDKKWWLINTNQEGLKFIPSGTTNKDDWQWAKAIWINPEGEVNTQGVKVKGERVLTTSDAEEKIPSRSGKDDNGVYTIYEETQEDGKLSKRSVLSSPDVDGNYLVRTVTYYKDGALYKTKIFDLKYDEDGDFVKAVPR